MILISSLFSYIYCTYPRWVRLLLDTCTLMYINTHIYDLQMAVTMKGNLRRKASGALSTSGEDGISLGRSARVSRIGCTSTYSIGNLRSTLHSLWTLHNIM
jgi:hypothetical protein